MLTLHSDIRYLREFAKLSPNEPLGEIINRVLDEFEKFMEETRELEHKYVHAKYLISDLKARCERDL